MHFDFFKKTKEKVSDGVQNNVAEGVKKGVNKVLHSELDDVKAEELGYGLCGILFCVGMLKDSIRVANDLMMPEQIEAPAPTPMTTYADAVRFKIPGTDILYSCELDASLTPAEIDAIAKALNGTLVKRIM